MDYIDQFQKHLYNEGTSYNTVRGYISDLKNFAQYLKESTSDDFAPGNIIPMDIADYRSYLQNVKNRKPATINRAVSSIRMFCEWAIDQDMLGRNPARKIKGVRKVKQAPQSLSRNQQYKLFRELEKDKELKRPPKTIYRDSSIIYVLLFCGLRVSELCNIRMADLSISDRKGTLTVTKGKGEKQRTVPISVDARKELAEYIERRKREGTQPEDLLFEGQRGPITPHCVRKVLKKYGTRAGIDDLHPHMLRYTFVRNLLDKQVSEIDIAAMTGHSDINTLAIYGKASIEQLQSAVDKVRIS